MLNSDVEIFYESIVYDNKLSTNLKHTPLLSPHGKVKLHPSESLKAFEILTFRDF